MNVLLIIVSIILIVYLFKFKNNENMTDILPNNYVKKCCLIEKQYLPDNNSLYCGNFKYTYLPKEKEDCDLFKYELNNNKQLLIDGINNWSNNNCNNDSKLGSCRINNFECVDFVDKQFCDKVPDMVWSDKTCQNPLDFTW